MEHPLQGLEEHEALKLILEGTSSATGHAFFRALVKALAAALRTQGAWVTRLDARAGELDSYAFWLHGAWVEHYRYAVKGTPCEGVITKCEPVHVEENVIELYPEDPDLRPLGAVSYLGVPLVAADGVVLGNLAVLDSRPMPADPRALAIIEIFAARASAEVSRLLAERELQSRTEQLDGLVGSALDAILQLDPELRIVRANPATERVFGIDRTQLIGRSFPDLLAGDSAARLRRHLEALTPAAPRPAGWISGLEALRADRSRFTAEASLARFEAGQGRFVTVILRDVDERLKAERQIATLRQETALLRDELRAIEGSGEILGSSPAVRTMLDDVAQVAPTSATVLILGETGTGKELVARAIHAGSARRDRPLVKLNCGAIPATLIESELFGHEKGAFTGATARRDGRFLAADGGTLFLDEVGELPLELQVKLLRVLQEGEFEPVGSSRTRKVDVRVVAATNRDLEEEVRAGRFRSDLFYRINVFPVAVPPLRERKEDVPVLAEAFARRSGEKIGRKVAPLTPEQMRRLQESDWPGNVRELQNVIERAVITARDGRLNLERALGDSAVATATPGSAPEAAHRVMTRSEMEAHERDNLVRALERTGWKVSGADGAAELLGLKPSTLSSRMRALGIRRPGTR